MDSVSSFPKLDMKSANYPVETQLQHHYTPMSVISKDQSHTFFVTPAHLFVSNIPKIASWRSYVSLNMHQHRCTVSAATISFHHHYEDLIIPARSFTTRLTIIAFNAMRNTLRSFQSLPRYPFFNTKTDRTVLYTSTTYTKIILSVAHTIFSS